MQKITVSLPQTSITSLLPAPVVSRPRSLSDSMISLGQVSTQKTINALANEAARINEHLHSGNRASFWENYAELDEDTREDIRKQYVTKYGTHPNFEQERNIEQFLAIVQEFFDEQFFQNTEFIEQDLLKIHATNQATAAQAVLEYLKQYPPYFQKCCLFVIFNLPVYQDPSCSLLAAKTAEGSPCFEQKGPYISMSNEFVAQLSPPNLVQEAAAVLNALLTEDATTRIDLLEKIPQKTLQAFYEQCPPYNTTEELLDNLHNFFDNQLIYNSSDVIDAIVQIGISNKKTAHLDVKTYLDQFPADIRQAYLRAFFNLEPGEDLLSAQFEETRCFIQVDGNVMMPDTFIATCISANQPQPQ